MNIRHFVSASAVAGALVLAAPALAQDINPNNPKSPCPDGFIPTFDTFNITGEDRNDNDVVCAKTTGGGDIFKDDRGS